tara:strand:+ start:1138 stop:1365 length:228 start_codon:yes stop_codon:yes gene_type:complete
MIDILAVDEATIIRLFWLFKIGFVHPVDAPGTVRGIILGFWRFEIQLILGFWDSMFNKELSNMKLNEDMDIEHHA